MNVEMLKSKIHRVTVTEARLDYIGSITIDADLLDAANILPGERVYRDLEEIDPQSSYFSVILVKEKEFDK